MPTVSIKTYSFHPSIWPKMIGEYSQDAKAGDLVEVLDKEGNPFGWGFFNPKSNMPLRVVSHGDEPIDEDFFLRAIENAAKLRRSLFHLDEETDTYRAIHGDADQLPGLVADKFGDLLSLEITTLAAWRRLDSWIPALHEAFGTNRAHVRVDPALSRVERIPTDPHPLSTESLRKVKVRENGITFEIDFAEGHKTGFFCDQRDNRRRFASLVEGKSVLDLCCYSGAFSVYAAKAGAGEITAVDLDEKAITMAKRNANINDARIKFTHADAFSWARTMGENGRQWDVVLADPPKFVTGRDDERGRGKYNDINKLASQLVKPGGLFVSCSCSGQVNEFEFEKLVTTAVHKQQRRLQIFNRTGAGTDHPTLSNYPESRYLKVIWSRVL
ncbi:class I SAM-dependent rRNA methyltransferase [Haloferula sp.]|uniref:class I SAM-dependent rRNA methyltransferase n=1 Tax=Haloferula sp. TaxID=2497595 RepID=UPI00329D8B9E